MARRAFVSSTRAYTRLSDKKIFLLKKLNLGNLSKAFGLQSAKSSKETTSDQYQQNLKEVNKNKYRLEKLEKAFEHRVQQQRKATRVSDLYKLEFV